MYLIYLFNDQQNTKLQLPWCLEREPLQTYPIYLWGLYCPPLIPAGIRQNPVNSRISIGINFGTVACQIDKTILAECGTEFTFRRNGSRNHREGMAPEWEERNRRCPSIPSSSTTTTTIDDAHLPLPPHHRCLITTITSSSPSPLATTHIRRP